MSDALGNMMYAERETLMWERWVQFQIKNSEETEFLEYFRQEWMGKIGIVFVYSSNVFMPVLYLCQ